MSKKFLVVQKQTVGESVFCDVITFSLMSFCIYISQGSKFWTFIAGLTFIFYFFSRINYYSKTRFDEFSSYAELKDWVNNPENEVK